MSKIRLYVWIMLAPVMMGSIVLVLLLVPELSNRAMELILPAVIAGAILAYPLSYIIAKKIRKLTPPEFQ